MLLDRPNNCDPCKPFPVPIPVLFPGPIPGRLPDPAETGLPQPLGIPGTGAIGPSDGLQDWYIHVYVNDLPCTGRGESRVSFIWLPVSFLPPVLSSLLSPVLSPVLWGEVARRGAYGEVGRPAGAWRGARRRRGAREAVDPERLAGGWRGGGKKARGNWRGRRYPANYNTRD